MSKFKNTIIALSTLSISHGAYSLQIDWQGDLGFDSTMINKYRFISEKDQSSSIDTGSQEVALGSGNKANASFQSYVFKLRPHIIVNDSASIKAEFTTGYASGGFLGDNSTSSLESDNYGNALYVPNTTTGEDLHIKKLYAEYFSDTATYVVGRQPYHWGLGSLYNSGEGLWDRHTYVRDGLTLKFKVGNFNLNPYWARISSGSTLTKATRMKEYGISLYYDNPNRDIAFGIHYAKNKNGANADAKTDIKDTSTPYPLAKTDVKITDLYFKKSFGRFLTEIEIPLMSGEIGNIYQVAGENSAKYRAKAIILKTSYALNDQWKVNFGAGEVSGHSGSESSYKAMFLNPNFQIANLLFRYNRQAVSSSSKSIYDSYVTNTRYLKFGVQQETASFKWNAAVIWAKANETAKAGTTSYNHSTNKQFVAVENQKDDLGTEVDFSIDYKWSKEIEIGASAGYLKTGDYWAFNNDTQSELNAKDSFVLQIKTGLSF